MPARITPDSEPAFLLHSYREAGRIATERYGANRQTLVFAATTPQAVIVALIIGTAGCPAVAIPTAAPAAHVDTIRAAFEAGEVGALVCTDVHAAGWWAPERCDLVLHVELPRYDSQFTDHMLAREGCTRHSTARSAPGEPTPDDLGRIVREQWIAWATRQPDPKPSWLTPWDEMDEADREVDRLIGTRLYAMGKTAGSNQ